MVKQFWGIHFICSLGPHPGQNIATEGYWPVLGLKPSTLMIFSKSFTAPQCRREWSDNLLEWVSSPSTLKDPGIELRLSALATDAFIHWTISPALKVESCDRAGKDPGRLVIALEVLWSHLGIHICARWLWKSLSFYSQAPERRYFLLVVHSRR